MFRIVKTTVLRNHLADVLKEVEAKEKFLLIARNEDVVSALVDIDFFEDLLAKTNKDYIAGIREARAQYKKGEVFSHADIFGKL